MAIARAVVGQPEVLIADEPTGNVDPEMGMRLLRLFAELNKLGTTIIIATHDLSLVRMLDAPVMSLSNGHLHIRPPRSQRQAQAESDLADAVAGHARDDAAGEHHDE